MVPATDQYKYLVEKPRVTGERLAASNFSGELLIEFQAPFTDSLLGDNNTARCKNFFHISVAQRKAELQQYGMADDPGWIAIT